eukprot:1610908-Rhodomonas_salina.1
MSVRRTVTSPAPASGPRETPFRSKLMHAESALEEAVLDASGKSCGVVPADVGLLAGGPEHDGVAEFVDGVMRESCTSGVQTISRTISLQSVAENSYINQLHLRAGACGHVSLMQTSARACLRVFGARRVAE